MAILTVKICCLEMVKCHLSDKSVHAQECYRLMLHRVDKLESTELSHSLKKQDSTLFDQVVNH